jgi:hypothetical protein
MTIAEIIERDGGPTAFSRRTGIPLRTVEDWKAGRRKCADYWVQILAEWLDRPNVTNELPRGSTNK